MKKMIFVLFAMVFVSTAYSQTVVYANGDITFTMTPCSKNRALSSIDYFIESKQFYNFDIYQFDYQKFSRIAVLQSGTIADFERVYNGFSYGTINIGTAQVDCIMYSNSVTGQYSLIQFADFKLGGGVVNQNLKRIFERSIEQVDNK